MGAFRLRTCSKEESVVWLMSSVKSPDGASGRHARRIAGSSAYALQHCLHETIGTDFEIYKEWSRTMIYR